ncbi:hypothetical protein [Sulfitobacter sp. M22]|uniref:hypothetical protein n=1 Tax=Sulfitobacter sp. M22 TaxID=2675332 RepID=UPI001F199F66|nr:hypothetical protein [Sulfitobacter sp. M22]MCF7725784.1 hypothetical protein [Sulfitobacter sp. M22]
MKIILPVPVSDLTLTASNVPEDDHAVWSALTTYERGDYAISLVTHTVYRSLLGDNTGNNPDLEAAALADPLVDNPDPVYWQIIGATNRWRIFDSKPSQPAVQAGSIEFEVRPGVFIGGIAGYGIVADTVRVRVYADPELIYDRTVEMNDESAVTDWLAYFVEPFRPLEEFVLTDLPVLGTPRIVVTLTGAQVAVGQIVQGYISELGITPQDGIAASGLDFSFVQTDDFGNLETMKREATRLMDFDVVVKRDSVAGVTRILKGLRGGTPAVWIASETIAFAATNYGFYRGYRTLYTGADHAIISIEIQGIV